MSDTPGVRVMTLANDIESAVAELRELAFDVLDTRTEQPERCTECMGTDGNHGLVHTRYGNGGGSNRPCSRTTQPEGKS